MNEYETTELNRNGMTITIGGTGSTISSMKIRSGLIGRTFHSKVVGFKPYGFFVETEDGRFGLVHGRNIDGWVWGKRFDRVFPMGTVVEVKVVDVEADTDRMSFSCAMPTTGGATHEDTACEDETVDPVSIPKTRREVAEQWVAEHSEASAAAFEWLKGELEDGPLYGPLTNVLADRFEMPIPVSYWIRRFPEFTCYSGQGDNPCDLPAVALSSRAGEVEYWNRIKRRTSDLLENAKKIVEKPPKHAELIARLDRIATFPGASWIRDYMKMCEGLALGKDVYGVTDAVERLVIPMLGQLGWDVSPTNAALVRGDDSTFNVKIFGGAASDGNISVAVKCATVGKAFDSLRGTDSPKGLAERDVVEQTLALYNRLGSRSEPKVVWTNGCEWVVFTRELLSSCIGVLADHRGVAIMDEIATRDDQPHCRRVVLSTAGDPLDWLAAFSDLCELIGNAG